MLTVLLIAVPLLVVAGVTTVVALLRAPEGYEDNECYHPEPRSLPPAVVEASESVGGRLSST